MRPTVVFLGVAAWFATACGGNPGGGDDERDSGVDLPPNTVMVDSGLVEGTPEADLLVFRGIPFAAPPVGELRFAPPVAPAPWTTPLVARDFGKACPQNGVLPAADQSEDCLTINVWAHAGTTQRPVIVWVHGGGYEAGSSREALYDGAALATTADAIIVSFNYRLGVLGFLVHSSVGNGNWGLRDQIAALAWVQRNIAAFGGDPERVMIAGESAGGASICTLLAAPAAQGLYAAAAMQSGTCRLVLELDRPSGTFPAATSVGAGVANDLGCTSGDIASCLRAAPVASILAANVPFSIDLGVPIGASLPVVDGDVLDQRPMAAIRAGRGAVPLIAGANREDTSFFIVNAMGVTNTPGSFATYLNQLPLTAPQRQTIAAMYPADLVTEIGAATAFSTDIAFACPALALASVRPATSRLYELQRHASGIVLGFGAVHGFDFILLFGTFSQWAITPAAEDLALRDFFQTAWGAHARSGVPDPAWPTVDAAGRNLALDATRTDAADWRGGRCAQLAALGLLPD